MIVRPGDRGAEVAHLHHALLERGALPPDAGDEVRRGVYGPVTGAAVRDLQARAGLGVDGVVGPLTWASLRSPAGPPELAPPPDLEGCGTALSRRALELADTELIAGVAEGPVPNRGPRVDAYLVGLDGTGRSILCARRYAGRRCEWCSHLKTPTDDCPGPPWCGRFARWCVDEAARQLGEVSPLADCGDLASALKWRDAAARRGRLHDDPQPGRVGVIVLAQERPGATPRGHLVMVAGVDDGWVWTREGNSGDRVAARRRSIGQFTGFVEV